MGMYEPEISKPYHQAEAQAGKIKMASLQRSSKAKKSGAEK